MSRGSKKQAANAGGTSNTHPQENYKEHRQFLIRSLERNDLDLAALTELNRTLHKAKESILQSCGELTLLDLGAGRLSSIDNELHEQTAEKEEPAHHLTPAQKALCVDFLLRMKLRRKLCSRLVRRLNRLAHSMDGEDITAPPPPRYGDMRLNIDASAVQARTEQWTRQAEAKQKILQAKLEEKAKQWQAREEKARKAAEQAQVELSKPKEEEPLESSPDTAESAPPKMEEKQQVESAKEGETGGKGKKIESTNDEPKPMDVDSSAEKTTEAVPDVEKPVEPTTEKASDASELEKPAEQTTEKAPDAIVSTTPAVEKHQIPDSPPSLKEEYEVLKEYEEAYEKVWDLTLKTFEYATADQEVGLDYDAVKNGAGIGATARIMSAQEREQEHKRWRTALLGRIPEQPTFEEWGLNNRVFCLEERRKRCLEADEEENEEGEPNKKIAKTDSEDELENEENSSNKKIAKTDEMDVDEPEKMLAKTDSDDEMVVDEDEEKPLQVAPAKKIGGKELRKMGDDEETETTKVEDDKKKEKVMDEKDGEQKEDKGDGDDSSDMFGDESSKDEKKERSEKEKKPDSDDDSSDMFGGDDEKEQEEEKKKEGSDATDTNDQSNKEKDEGESQEDTEQSAAEKPEKEEEEKKAEELIEEPIKRIRPMSLVAIPSFHEQDMIRLRMIHNDLLATSILEHARRRLSDVTKDYNNAFRVSNQLFDHRTRLTQSFNFFLSKSRTDLAKANNDYALQVAIAKQRWLKDKKEHDSQRTKSAMPSTWGRPPFGTNFIQSYMRTQGMSNVIGMCLADLIDGSILIAEGKLPIKKFDDFKAPAAPSVNKQTGETLAQTHLRMEGELRRQINDATAKFSASEEERKRAWRKMMKTKAELEVPKQQHGARRGRIDLSNYHSIPVPALRQSTQQVMPRELDFARTSVATYTPPRSTGFGQGDTGSDSKYSAARVKDRIASDGTVAPVSEPKKTRDGLYQRPAGRTRKGMQWDAIRGIWVPEGSQ